MSKVTVAGIGACALVVGLLGQIPESAAEPPSVVYVVATPASLSVGETAVRSRLQGSGFDVVLADDATVSTADVAGKAFVLVSSTVDGAALSRRLLSVPETMWIAKPYLFDDYGLTGPQAGIDYESKRANDVTITTAGHPLAAGRTGTVAFQTGTNRMSWGRPAASATIVATADADPTIFTIAAGQALVGGAPAAGCRMTFPLFNNAPTAFTADGWALFDAAASWAAGSCGAEPVDTPPSVALTSPANGATVGGSVSVTATATDDVGVTSVEFSVDGASIGTDTNGVDGWAADWDTTVVADGSHTVGATATDTATQTATATRTVTVSNTSEPPVVMVVGSPATLTAGDTAVRQRLLGSGYDVQVVDDGAVTAASVAGTSFVLVNSSVDSNVLGRRLETIAVPLWLAKPYLFDDYRLTGPQAGVDYESKSATSVTITTPGHALAAGRTGTVAFQTGSSRVSWGRPPASATVVATAGADPTIFTIPQGAALVGGQAAPGCRMTFPLFNAAPTTFTVNGWALFDAAAAWAAAGCAGGPPPPPPPGDVEHVVFISVDGLNSAAITTLGPTGAPTLHRLIGEGVSTMNARTSVEATQTLPNHTSMTSGRRVALPDGHGVTFNDDNGSTVHGSAGSYVTGIFDLVHDSGGSTVLFASKTKFDFLDRSWNGTNGAPDVTGADNGRDKIDTYQVGGGSATTSAVVGRLATNPPTFTFVHLADPDNAGHASVFGSPAYLAAVTTVDGYIGQIVDTVASDPDLVGRTVVIVTTDHGGTGISHADPTVPTHYTIPFLAWGPDVAAGADLYALNPDRLDPGTAQPPYSASVPPIRSGEVANLVAELLRLPTVPGSQFNTDKSLDLAMP